MAKAKYMTRQRKLLLSYLGRHPDKLMKAQEVADALEPESVSLSAVYRNLAELEEEGTVRRTHKGALRETYFQYMGAETCRDCLHLSCTKCGRTFHMDNEEAQRILEAVAMIDGFAIDKSETVLCGVCELCQ